MKKLICIFASIAAAVPLAAATLSEAERGKAIAELNQSRDAFIASVTGLSPAQWNFKPDANTWSVFECAEHIALSEDLIFGMVQKTAQAPTTPDKKDALDDDTILKLVVNRSQKFKAPEPLQPKHTFASPQELLDHFQQSRAKTIAYVQSTQDDLRAHMADHPVLKTLDAYQWILLLSGHTRRHTAQLNEVKSNPNFPKE